MIWRWQRPADGSRASGQRGRFFALGTLHSKLLAAFAVVIFVALGTAAAGMLSLVQRYQTQRAVDHLSDIALITARQVRWLSQAGASPSDIATVVATQAEHFGVRILLLDSENRTLEDIAADHSFSLRDRLLAFPESPRARLPLNRRLLRQQIVAWKERLPPLDGPHVFIAAMVPPPRLGRGRGVFRVRPPATGGVVQRVVLVVPEASLATAWRELAPSLAIAALIALAVSAGAALWLSGSIARPLRRITQASEAMAQGDYQQSIPVRGRDEVAQLARAFNTMAREVDRSNQALRAFLADASHELRTPLTSVQGWAQALMEGEVQGTVATTEAGEIIYGDAERMNRLVESLLYLSRIEGGQVPIERMAVDLGELLRVAVARITPRADQAGQRIATHVPALSPVLGDVGLLERLFGNLLDNAVKYAPPGATITITAGTGTPPALPAAPSSSPNGAAPRLDDGRAGGEARVQPAAAQPTAWVIVHNSDSVIPAKDLPHVFERFYRVERSRAQRVEGAGLGLAIAHEIAEAHGGDITAASSPTAGTLFTVLLPATSDRGEQGREGQRVPSTRSRSLTKA